MPWEVAQTEISIRLKGDAIEKFKGNKSVIGH